MLWIFLFMHWCVSAPWWLSHRDYTRWSCLRSRESFQSYVSQSRDKEVHFIRVWDGYLEGKVSSSHAMIRHRVTHSHSENMLYVMLIRLCSSQGGDFNIIMKLRYFMIHLPRCLFWGEGRIQRVFFVFCFFFLVPAICYFLKDKNLQLIRASRSFLSSVVSLMT